MSREANLAEKFFDVYHVIDYQVDNAMNDKGTSVSKNKILSLLDTIGPCRSTEIIKQLGLTQRLLTQEVDTLENNGLAERKTDLKDRRLKLISITEKGKEALLSSENIREEMLNKFFGVFNLAQNDHFVSLLDKLHNNLR